MSVYEHSPVLEPPAVLVPNTSLPATAPGQALQPEGRGTVELEPRIIPPSLFERLGDIDGIDAMERAVIGAALRQYDNQPRSERNFYTSASGITDATTANAVIPLFTVPGGDEALVTQVTVDAPQQATINPSAPFASASAWAFISIAGTRGLGGSGSGTANADADTLRQGLVAFAPVSAGGPILPGQWTFTEDQAPVAFGGQTVFYVLHGGSVAAIKSLSLIVRARFNLLGPGRTPAVG